MKSIEIFENTRSFDELVVTLTHSNRCTKCSNTRISIGNEFPMKKYIEAVVRKSSQLRILTETDHLKIYSCVSKKTYQKEGLKKMKLYCHKRVKCNFTKLDPFSVYFSK